MIKVVMNKPVYLDQAILDLSKTVKYEFHYDYVKQKYNSDRLQLCYMDTDSLVYHIKLMISMLTSQMTYQRDLIHLVTLIIDHYP